MILQLNRKVNQLILLYGFLLIVFFCRYRLTADVGDVILPVEILGIICAFFTRDKSKRDTTFLFFIYIIFILYREGISYALIGKLTGETKIIIYRELGVLLLFASIIEANTVHSIVYGVRDLGMINAAFATIEYITKYNFCTKMILNKNLIFAISSMNTSNWRVRTVFIHPIICAVFLTITWAILLYFPYKNRIMNYIFGGTIIVGIIGTKSRSSWISLFFITILYLVKKWYTTHDITINKNSLYYFISILFVTIVLVAIVPEKVSELTNSVISRTVEALNGNNSSNYNRVKMIIAGIREWRKFSLKNKLFGQGASYAIEYLKAHPIRGWNIAVDNTYITVLMNYGAVGLGLLFVMLLESFFIFLTTKSKLREMAALTLISIFISGFFYEIHGWFTSTICLSVFCLIASYRDLDMKK